jgi:VanZ family protein
MASNIPSPLVHRVTGRVAHCVICFGLLLFVSWGLLTPDPLAVVKRSPLSILTTVSDLLMHCCVFGVFSVACCSLTARSSDPRVQKAILFLLMVYSTVTELLQVYVPRRTCDPLDAIANIAGIVAGAVLVNWFTSRRPRTATALG